MQGTNKKVEPRLSSTWAWITSAMTALADVAEKAIADMPVPTFEERDRFGKAAIRLGRIVTSNFEAKK